MTFGSKFLGLIFCLLLIAQCLIWYGGRVGYFIGLLLTVVVIGKLFLLRHAPE